ncbi:hypothetical protein HTIA_1905 [Halorhabdus tiamatea SARL4B]|uniref:Uncharacterized protein n=1 Tax=Halorhabdus tiamatea SARL4B TaxID=1033806 RepID=S6CTZ9_9EURY|nr:hypothetical protein HTIA_1905 [Halorhabdus tiamatea SARL4B]
MRPFAHHFYAAARDVESAARSSTRLTRRARNKNCGRNR